MCLTLPEELNDRLYFEDSFIPTVLILLFCLILFIYILSYVFSLKWDHDYVYIHDRVFIKN